MVPFFVVGTPRSGTTLLAVLCDRHSRISVPPETGFFAEVAPKLAGNDRDATLAALREWPRLPELNLTPEAVLARLDGHPYSPRRVLLALLELYAGARGKPRCGEKTPQHLMHVPAILDQFPESKIVCLLRDGRDVVLSLRAMPWGTPTLEAAARLWKQYVQTAELCVARYPEHFSVFYYEHLVADPARVVAEVMAHVGESFEATQLQPAPSDVVLQRSWPWKSQALGPIDPAQAGRRRHEAAGEEIRMIEELLADELRRHGYTK
jgi:hypothetical protein